MAVVREPLDVLFADAAIGPFGGGLGGGANSGVVQLIEGDDVVATTGADFVNRDHAVLVDGEPAAVGRPHGFAEGGDGGGVDDSVNGDGLASRQGNAGEEAEGASESGFHAVAFSLAAREGVSP